jgi:hypothetical protein
MLALIKTTPDNTTIIIIDSAPAAFVHREITQHFHQHYRNCVVLFPPAPQQTRGSEDCGIFVIIGVIRLLLEEHGLLARGDWFFPHVTKRSDVQAKTD